jgi:hypothetical protein
MSAPGVPVGPGPGGDPAPSGQEQNQTTPPKAGKSQSKSNQPVLGAPAKKANPENAPLAATELLKQNPIGSKTLEKKTIRVQGTVARPWNQGWIYLTGDGRRTIACLFKQPPQPPPAAGQTVVVEGTFFESLPEHVTIGNCRVVPASGSGAGEDAGGFPLLLSNARVSWAKRVWTVSFQYRFVDGRPDPALYYFFEGQFPGGQMFLHRVKGSELQPAGFIHKRVTLFQVYPDSGDTVFDVYFSKSQTSRSTKDRMARTVKVPFKAPKLWLYSSYTTEELLAAAAPGDQSLIGKRIRVTGRMAIGVAVGRDFKLTGSNGRNITCRASVQEKSRPPVGAEVVVDGVVAAVNKFGVTLAVCRFGNVQPNANQAAVLRSENNGVTKSSTLPVVVQ